ncbi:hypothetical protein ACLKA6_011099 [Drosophila palustris]
MASKHFGDLATATATAMLQHVAKATATATTKTAADDDAGNVGDDDVVSGDLNAWLESCRRRRRRRRHQRKDASNRKHSE